MTDDFKRLCYQLRFRGVPLYLEVPNMREHPPPHPKGTPGGGQQKHTSPESPPTPATPEMES